MRNPRPIVARCNRGPLKGQTFRIRPGQFEITVWKDGRTHIYELVWPRDKAAVALEVPAHYRGTRKR